MSDPAAVSVPEPSSIPVPTTLVCCDAFWAEPIPGPDYLFHFDHVWVTPELKAVIDGQNFRVNFIQRQLQETPAPKSP